MPTTQSERIRNLVRISPVLSAAERSEWLSMVDLMNGKQLSDLEHILTAGISRAVVQHGPVPHPAEPRPPQAPKTLGPSPDNPVQNLRPTPRPAAAAVSGTFGAQLKRTVDTTELEPGPEELELPPPRAAMPAPRPQPPALPKPAAPAPAPAAAPKMGAAPGLPPKPSFQPPAPAMPKLQPRVAPPMLAQNPSSSIQQKIQPKPSAPPPVPLPPAPAPNPAPAPTGPPPQLKSAEDLIRLNVSGWRAFPPSAFVRAATAAVSRSGLAAAVGALEKSPLMQAYIETGLAALGQRAAGGGLAAPSLLTRPEFERLSDDLKTLHLH